MSFQEPDELFSKPTVEEFYNAWQRSQRQRALEATSDLELTRELVKRLGLNHSESRVDVFAGDYFDGPNKYYNSKATFPQYKANHIILLGAGVGYGGFACEFYFNKDGKLLGHGVWE